MLCKVKFLYFSCCFVRARREWHRRGASESEKLFLWLFWLFLLSSSRQKFLYFPLNGLTSDENCKFTLRSFFPSFPFCLFTQNVCCCWLFFFSGFFDFPRSPPQEKNESQDDTQHKIPYSDCRPLFTELFLKLSLRERALNLKPDTNPTWEKKKCFKRRETYAMHSTRGSAKD